MTLMDWLGFFSDIIGIGTLIFTIVVFWQAKRRLSKALLSLEPQGSAKPAALAVGLGQDIRAAVEQHLQEEHTPMLIFNYYRSGLVQREQFHEVLRQLLEVKQQITAAGASEVHLFYMGPVTLAVGIGSILDNWLPVTVYKYGDGRYKPEFVLQKETVLGLLDEAVDTGVDLVT